MAPDNTVQITFAPIRLRRRLRKLTRRLGPDFVVHDRVVLPPVELPICGRDFMDDSYFATSAFVEDGVAPVTINPDDYIIESAGPLNVSRYERAHLLSIFADGGLAVDRFDYGTELDGQSGIHLRLES